MGTVKKRVLQPKVTVASVKREWEEKYAALNRRYEELCKAHLDLAKIADTHYANFEDAQKIAVESLAECLRKEGVISYLDKKLELIRGNSDDSV